MTQPVDPLLGLKPLPALQPIGSQGAPTTGPAAALSFLKQDPTVQQGLAEDEARRQADLDRATRQRALESQYGAAPSSLGYVGKGVLDVLLAPGALLGATVEGWGHATGAEGLEDWGRDLGRASSGAAALPVLAAIPELLTGDGKKAATVHDASAQRMREMAEAWPLLTSMSALAGEAATGLALGGLASGTQGLVALSAAEGAAGGAQTAYEKNAAYRDVLATAGLGAVLAGGMAYGLEAGVGALQKRAQRNQQLRELYGEAVQAEEKATRKLVTAEAAGGKEAQSVIVEIEKAREAAHKAAQAAGDNPARRKKALDEAVAHIKENLSEKAGKFTPAAWVDHPPTALQKVLYRSQILDQASQDVAQAAQRSVRMAPGIEFDLSPKALKVFLKDADGPAAIGALQQRIAAGIQDAPSTELAQAIAADMRKTFEVVMVGPKLAESMQASHRLVQRLTAAAEQADELTAAYAKRQAGGLAMTMTGEQFGTAGKLYRDALTAASERAQKLTDAAVVRDALRLAESRGNLVGIVRDHSNSVGAALDAQARLAGRSSATSAVDDLVALEKLVTKAEDAATLDGGPVRRVVEWFKDKAEDKTIDAISSGIGGAIGGYPGFATAYAVSHFLRPRMGAIMGAVQRSARRASGRVGKALARAGKPTSEFSQVYTSDWAENAAVDALASRPGVLLSKAVTRAQQQAQFEARSKALAYLATNADLLEEPSRAIDKLVPGSGQIAAADMAAKAAQLLEDMPKVEFDFRGKSSPLNSDELRRQNAYWEATFDPGSTFDDLAAGHLDPDKLAYTWKQHPGLLEATRLGLLDMWNQLSDEDADAIPSQVLSQLDRFAQLDGALEKSQGKTFARQVDALAKQHAEQAAKAPQNKPLSLITSRPTPMQRVAGARR